MAASTVDSTSSASSGTTGNYSLVKLDPPPGATPGLKAFIAMCEAAIQMFVDLLGRGVPELPPDVAELLQPIDYEDLLQGESGQAAEDYRAALAEVEDLRTSLLDLDSQIIETSIVVVSEQDQTLRKIEQVVADIEDEFARYTASELTPDDELWLMEFLGEKLAEVCDLVATAADTNTDLSGATSISSIADGVSGAGGGSGGGGGIESLLSALMTLPMAAMPLLELLPEGAEEEEPETGQAPAETPTPPTEPAAESEPAAAGATPAENKEPATADGKLSPSATTASAN
ncbi:hypothetical protein ACFVMC_29425 [Nocardia sp. NPDC127579]|uniref:hypothetical protein n=1 Tax=Nocardia sp. NPDC127579 TaxID=3345402 RepID=UPI0036261C65